MHQMAQLPDKVHNWIGVFNNTLLALASTCPLDYNCNNGVTINNQWRAYWHSLAIAMVTRV